MRMPIGERPVSAMLESNRAARVEVAASDQQDRRTTSWRSIGGPRLGRLHLLPAHWWLTCGSMETQGG
jgi:hypothetical protein